jgi:hypothetical protein
MSRRESLPRCCEYADQGHCCDVLEQVALHQGVEFVVHAMRLKLEKVAGNYAHRSAVHRRLKVAIAHLDAAFGRGVVPAIDRDALN